MCIRDRVNFYQVIPLYEDELDYKLEHDTDALLNKMRGISFVQQSVCIVFQFIVQLVLIKRNDLIEEMCIRDRSIRMAARPSWSALLL